MKEFKCSFCDKDATKIAYYSKAYPTGTGYTIENPTLCCDLCFKSPKIINQISALRGGDEGVFSFPFKKIGMWSKKELGFFLSHKKWEINHLSTLMMRKLIWRIHFKHGQFK